MRADGGRRSDAGPRAGPADSLSGGSHSAKNGGNDSSAGGDGLGGGSHSGRNGGGDSAGGDGDGLSGREVLMVQPSVAVVSVRH